MTKIFTIPISNYDDRVKLIKQFRTELGPVGNTWSFFASGKGLEISVKYPEQCSVLTMLILKYGDQIKVRTR